LPLSFRKGEGETTNAKKRIKLPDGGNERGNLKPRALEFIKGKGKKRKRWEKNSNRKQKKCGKKKKGDWERTKGQNAAFVWAGRERRNRVEEGRDKKCQRPRGHLKKKGKGGVVKRRIEQARESSIAERGAMSRRGGTGIKKGEEFQRGVKGIAPLYRRREKAGLGQGEKGGKKWDNQSCIRKQAHPNEEREDSLTEVRKKEGN